MRVTKLAPARGGLSPALLLAWALVLMAALGNQLGRSATPKVAADEPEAKFQVVADESRALDDDQLGDIVKDFGEQLRDTMDEEMARLIHEVELAPAKPASAEPATSTSMSTSGAASSSKPSEAELAKLREANRAASEEIKTHVQLAADTSGAVPQAGLGVMASSFIASASSRLSAAGAYINNKMSTLGSSIAGRVPARIRRFFRWPSFLKFKIRYHKTYKSLREELYRQMVFMRTHIVVGMQHMRFLLRRDKHVTAQNQFADTTGREYLAQVQNPQAERSAAELAEGAAERLDERARAQLLALASQRRDIFGHSMESALGGSIDTQGPAKSRQRRAAGEDLDEPLERDTKRQRRARRAVDSMASELDDSEDDDYMDVDELDEELGNELAADANMMDVDSDNDNADGDDDDERSAFKVVEEFANDIDLSALDELEASVDQVLDGRDHFTGVDLRDTGCLIRPENQNGCGFCYSCAMNAAASYYNCMDDKRDHPERYNPRFLSDCGKYMTPAGKYPVINGCRGGRLSHAFLFAQTVGVQRFAEYNIARVSAKVFEENTCAYPRPESLGAHGWKANIVPVHSFQGTRFTLLKLDEVDLHLRTVGPVFVNIRPWKHFKQYEAGIYDGFEEDEASVLHSMLVVGHERDSRGRDYYILMNSHGIVWGENGYVRVYSDSLEYFAALFGGLAPLQADD